MSVSLNDSVQTTVPSVPVRCECGLLWNISMERGAAGKPGFVPCSCGAELVAWSGTIVFNASPAD